jgi:hypothetical protein
MLIGALSTSLLQYHLTRLFPHLKFSKYAYCCTFDNIAKKVNTSGADCDMNQLKRIERMFLELGVENDEISDTIKLIQELGTSTSHPTAMIDVEGNQYTGTPNYEEIQQIIEHVDLSNEFKDAATVLLNILRQIVPSGTTLLYSKP